MRSASLFTSVLMLTLGVTGGCSSGLSLGSWGSSGSSPFSTPSAASAPSSSSSSWLNPVTGLSKLSSSVSNSVQKVGSSLSVTDGSKITSPNDPTSLNSKVATVGPELHTSAAALYETQGNIPAAMDQYQRAMKIAPDDPNVLLGYARLNDRQNRFDEAIASYRKVIDRHPDNATALNDLGLCYARQGQLDPATQALGQAVQLQPGNPLYRNNLARTLVQAGRVDEAFGHLSAVMSPAYAHYNLGYLLYERGDSAGAMQHFGVAAQQDPNLAQARQMLDKIKSNVNLAQQQYQQVGQQVSQQYQQVSQQYQQVGQQVAQQYQQVGQQVQQMGQQFQQTGQQYMNLLPNGAPAAGQAGSAPSLPTATPPTSQPLLR